jgi:hypothetical protein
MALLRSCRSAFCSLSVAIMFVSYALHTRYMPFLDPLSPEAAQQHLATKAVTSGIKLIYVCVLCCRGQAARRFRSPHPTPTPPPPCAHTPVRMGLVGSAGLGDVGCCVGRRSNTTRWRRCTS